MPDFESVGVTITEGAPVAGRGVFAGQSLVERRAHPQQITRPMKIQQTLRMARLVSQERAVFEQKVDAMVPGLQA